VKRLSRLDDELNFVDAADGLNRLSRRGDGGSEERIETLKDKTKDVVFSNFLFTPEHFYSFPTLPKISKRSKHGVNLFEADIDS
jgi:hypothetical protein